MHRLGLSSCATRHAARQLFPTSSSRCLLHTTPQQTAAVNPMTAAGPPPPAPMPSADYTDQRMSRRRAHAEAVGRISRPGMPAASKSSSKPLRRRFWTDVGVKEVNDVFHVLLDARPLRTPTKEIMVIPGSKPFLATALALEWDLLTSAQQATKQHLIPLTSLVSRALDIAAEDEATSGAPGPIRLSIARSAMRYLSTDTLLCWAPEEDAVSPSGAREGESLRSIQQRTSQPIIDYLTEHVWPGVEIVPVLDNDSIMPREQPTETKEAIEKWVMSLPSWELAGLERAILAGKGLLAAARLVAEWSEHLGHVNKAKGERFGVEEAAHASSVEVRYQTDMWGEVEDTHDVEREDLRRQLGSVVLLVSGTPRPGSA